MAQAVEDLETIRTSLGIDDWIVLGHSWGCDLAVRYALDYPTSVRRVIGIAGHGLHKDRTWSRHYEELKDTEPDLGIPWDRAVHQSLGDSFTEWIHEPKLFRALADSSVSMNFIAAGNDIRLPWPLEQLAELVPDATFDMVPDVPHDFWSTHPQAWIKVVTAALIEPGERGR